MKQKNEKLSRAEVSMLLRWELVSFLVAEGSHDFTWPGVSIADNAQEIGNRTTA